MGNQLMPSKQILELVESMIEKQEQENATTSYHLSEMTMLSDLRSMDVHRKYLSNGIYLVSNLKLLARRIKGELK